MSSKTNEENITIVELQNTLEKKIKTHTGLWKYIKELQATIKDQQATIKDQQKEIDWQRRTVDENAYDDCTFDKMFLKCRADFKEEIREEIENEITEEKQPSLKSVRKNKWKWSGSITNHDLRVYCQKEWNVKTMSGKIIKWCNDPVTNTYDKKLKNKRLLLAKEALIKNKL